MLEHQLLTVRQTAYYLRVSTRTIQLWISQGRFPHAYKLSPGNSRNSPYRIPRADLETFQRRQRMARAT
jgi:excisionase family DNA binding protein